MRLQHQKNHRFDQRILAAQARFWPTLKAIDELKGQWITGANLGPQALGRLKRSVLVSSTGASTRIEGSHLTDEDIEKLMRGISIQKFKDRDAQEVQGYYELLMHVFDAWKHLRFTESSIKHFHKELLKCVGKDQRHRGEYKKTENSVEMFDADGISLGVVFRTTQAYLTPKEMLELVEWTQHALAQGTYHPLLVIGHFIVEFLSIHPFQDGNGRLSRILTNFLLLKHGYTYVSYASHEKLVEENKVEYYLALRRTQKTLRTDKENMIPWLEFFLRIVLEQSTVAIGLLSKENIDKILSPKQLIVWTILQRGSEATPRSIARETGISKKTISQGISALLRLKLIERVGLGRSTRYRKMS